VQHYTTMFVGLDVHEDLISVASAPPARHATPRAVRAANRGISHLIFLAGISIPW